MGPDASFQEMMDRLRAGDDTAASRVFQRFAYRLIGLAHSRLSDRLRQKLDAEDVLQSVFRSFFAGHAEGQFHVLSWDGLWGLLADITLRKCARTAEYYRADRRDVQREVAAAQPDDSQTSWQGLARDPTPEEAALLTETVEQLLRGLEPDEHDMVVLSLQGHAVQEIAVRVGRAERSVYRILERLRRRLERLRDAGASES